MKNLILTAALILVVGTTFGQTLQKGNVVGTHVMTINLDPDVTMNQFKEFFANKLIPEWEKHFTGAKVYLLKGIRGENENSFGVIFIFGSEMDRNKYWKEEEAGFTELGEEANEKLTPILEELNKLGTWTTEYTDWVVL